MPQRRRWLESFGLSQVSSLLSHDEHATLLQALPALHTASGSLRGVATFLAAFLQTPVRCDDPVETSRFSDAELSRLGERFSRLGSELNLGLDRTQRGTILLI